MISAPVTPNVVRHLEPDDEYAQVQFLGTFPEGVGALGLVEAALLRIVVRRVVHVRAFAFSHLAAGCCVVFVGFDTL